MQVKKQGQGQGQDQTQTSMADALQQAQAQVQAQTRQAAGSTGDFMNNNSQTTQAPTVRSFRDMTNVFNRTTLSRNNFSENMTKIYKVMRDAAELAKDPLYNVNLTPMSSENFPDLQTNIILVTVTSNESPRAVAYHSFILGSSAQDLTPYRVTQDNVQYEMARLASNTMTRAASETIAKEVKNQHAGRTPVPASQTVIPAFLRPDDQIDAENIIRAMANGVIACCTMLDRSMSTWRDIALQEYCGPNSAEHLETSVTFGNRTETDCAANPIRSDMKIQVSAVPNRRDNLFQQQMMEEEGRRVAVSKVSGFVDLVFDETRAQIANNVFANQQLAQNNEQQQLFVPMIVLSSVTNALCQSPAGQWLALIAGLDCMTNGIWVNNLYPKQITDRPADMNDIGAIAIQANIERSPTGYGSPIDAQSDVFIRNGHFNQLINAFVRNRPMLAMDVIIMGGEYWYNNLFVAAAEGNAKAIDRLIDAGDQLTGNRFRNNLNQAFSGQPIKLFACEPQIHHDGYWVDANGRRHSIADVDYLAVANHYGKQGQPQMITEWNRTFTMTNISLQRRLHERAGMIRAVLGGGSNVVFNNWRYRLIWDARAIQAMRSAIEGCGYRPIMTYGNDANNQQAGITQAYLNSAGIDTSSFSSMYGVANNGAGNLGAMFAGGLQQGQWSVYGGMGNGI